MSSFWSWPSFYALVSVLIISAVSLVGLLMLCVDEARLREWVLFLVSLSVGAMFGDAFIHLLPEAFARTQSPLATSFYVLMGLFLFFVLEKFLRWRHQHLPLDEDCVQPLGYANLVADGIHNFVDGILIGAGFLVSIPIGVATALAVLLHEIPQEISDFGVLLHAGFSRSQAIALNFLSATLAILGAVIALVAGTRVTHLSEVMLPLAAGGFVYIAGCDLVPELHRESEVADTLSQLVGIGIGVGLMFLLALRG